MVAFLALSWQRKAVLMRILITGASGSLGSWLVCVGKSGDNDIRAWSGAAIGSLAGVPFRSVELTDAEATARAFAADRPDVVIHCAALASVADCHRNPDRARAINVEATRRLAKLVDDADRRLAFVSTDMVFDGEQGGYREQDVPRPLSVYGRSKLEAESAVLAARRGLVIRVSLLYGSNRTGRSNTFSNQAAALRERQSLRLFFDEWRTPLALSTAANAILELAASDVTGLLHLGGPERLSRLEMGLTLARHLGVSAEGIAACRRQDFDAAEPRPRDLSLDSSAWRQRYPNHPWPDMTTALREMDEQQ
jgi:dTDP-4-dehydrorhamnose reductase